MTGGVWAIALTAFLASAVEAVEALSIVLAVGVTKGWRPALQGTALAIVALGVLVAVGVPILHIIPDTWLKIVVGAFAIWFGWHWLHKAILRAAGLKELKDEQAAYDRRVVALQEAREQRGAFVIALNGVFLEGLEVALIVLAVGGAHYGGLQAAVFGAVVAIVLVAAVGVALHAPLSRVPENLMKYVVGVMLTTFGIFWLGEGLGIAWPGDDLALLGLALAVLAASLIGVSVLRMRAVRSTG